jgi:hypothetical protein
VSRVNLPELFFTIRGFFLALLYRVLFFHGFRRRLSLQSKRPIAFSDPSIMRSETWSSIIRSETRSEEEEPRPFYVSINTVKGNKTLYLELHPNDTFAHLKFYIQSEIGILYEDQNLFVYELDSELCGLKPVDRDTVKVCPNNFDFSCQSSLTLELHLVVATERASDALFAFTQVPPNLRRSLCLNDVSNWPPTPFDEHGDVEENGDIMYVRQIGGENGPLFRRVRSHFGRNWQTRIITCIVCHKSNGILVESDKEAIVLGHCGGCHSGDYCSEECQRKDWYNGHRLECKFTKVELAWKETIKENAELQKLHIRVASEFDAEEVEVMLHENMELDAYSDPINYALVTRFVHQNRNDCGVISFILQKSIFEEYITEFDIKRANLTDVIPCILSVMRINLEDVAMQIVCIEALRSMISLDRFSEPILLKAAGVREIVFAMDKHSSNLELQHVCLNVLVLLTSGSKRYLQYCAEIKEVYYPRGATAVGVTAVGLAAKVLNKYSKLKTDGTSNILAQRVLVAIRHLIDFGSSDFWLTCKRAQDANVQQATLVLLNKRQGSAEIQRNGLGLLRELATNPSTIPFTNEDPACIRAIVRAMNKHSLDMGIAERGLQFFQYFVQSSPTGLFCTSKPEVLSVILQSLRKFPDSSSLAQLAMPTLGEILFDHIGDGETMRIARTVDTAVVINRAKSFIITDFRGFSPRPARAGSWVALCDCLLNRLSLPYTHQSW